MALRKESGSSPNLPMAELQLKQYVPDPTRPVVVIHMELQSGTHFPTPFTCVDYCPPF